MYYPPIIDLHTHSTCSDGTFSPAELVHLAKKQGLAAIALTDHDCIDGLTAFLQAGKKNGLETICGIEFATVWKQAHSPEIHIVGLGFDPTNETLQTRIQKLRNDRNLRNVQLCEKLTALGMPITIEELQENASGNIITRAHVANVLLQKGYLQRREEAFSRYLCQGMPAYVERSVLSPEVCIRTIKEAGGAAVLAHPLDYSLTPAQLEAVCLEMHTYGLDGIECYYPTFSTAERNAMEALAKKCHLLPSGGSDFHGGNRPGIRLGRGKGNLEIPYSVWEALKAHTK